MVPNTEKETIERRLRIQMGIESLNNQFSELVKTIDGIAVNVNRLVTESNVYEIRLKLLEKVMEEIKPADLALRMEQLIRADVFKGIEGGKAFYKIVWMLVPVILAQLAGLIVIAVKTLPLR
jgi:Ni,Fe-hydrogenase III component G